MLCFAVECLQFSAVVAASSAAASGAASAAASSAAAATYQLDFEITNWHGRDALLLQRG